MTDCEVTCDGRRQPTNLVCCIHTYIHATNIVPWYGTILVPLACLPYHSCRPLHMRIRHWLYVVMIVLGRCSCQAWVHRWAQQQTRTCRRRSMTRCWSTAGTTPNESYEQKQQILRESSKLSLAPVCISFVGEAECLSDNANFSFCYCCRFHR